MKDYKDYIFGRYRREGLIKNTINFLLYSLLISLIILNTLDTYFDIDALSVLARLTLGYSYL